MLLHQRFVPTPVHSLLNNLDAALAACAELQSAFNPHDLLRLELTVIAHVLQARAHMRELKAADAAVTSQIALFLAVTDCLEQKGSGSGETAHEAAAVRLIAGQIPVPTLMSLAAAMRDVLELCRATFDEETAAALQGQVPISEAQVWATGPEAG